MPTPRHRVSGPAELLDAIPYLLGFHPAESLVLVGLDAGQVTVTARLDLADTDQPDLVANTVAALARSGSDEFIAVVVDDEAPAPTGGEPLPWDDLVISLARSMQDVGARCSEALFVGGGRWWSFVCAEPLCCPTEGRPLASGSSAFAAAATFEGVVALPNRASLQHSLEPAPETERRSLEPLVLAAADVATSSTLDGQGESSRRRMARQVMLAARASAAPEWQPPDDETVARFAAALRVVAVRDEVWMALDARDLDGRCLWAELARRAPAPYDAAPLFLFGWACWRSGSGALAGIAAERALASDESYSAADLLVAVLTQAVDPRTFPRLSADRPAGRRANGVRGRPRRGRPAAVARTPR